MAADIDRIVCEALGIAKVSEDWYFRQGQLHIENGYPPISTDGNAMLRVMDALRGHPWRRSVELHAGPVRLEGQVESAAIIMDDKGGLWCGYDEKLPMALALAVQAMVEEGACNPTS